MVIAATDEYSISYILSPWGLHSKGDPDKAQRMDGNHSKTRGCYYRPEDRNILLVDPRNVKVTKAGLKEM